MKTLLNPLIFSAFIVTMLLGSIAHLMYGNSQTSKWHYMAQRYWMPKYLPEKLVDDQLWWGYHSYSSNNYSIPVIFPNRLMFSIHQGTYSFQKIDLKYTGVWQAWDIDGELEHKGSFKNGIEHGLHNFYSKDRLYYEGTWANGKKDGEHTAYYDNSRKNYVVNFYLGNYSGDVKSWFYDGTKEYEGQFSDDFPVGIHSEYNKDGTLNKKEYYDLKGNFQKRELFEKGKLVKTEVEE